MKVIEMLGGNLVVESFNPPRESGIITLDTVKAESEHMRSLKMFKVLHTPPPSKIMPGEEVWCDSAGNAWKIPVVGSIVLIYTTMLSPWMGRSDEEGGNTFIVQANCILAVVDPELPQEKVKAAKVA